MKRLTLLALLLISAAWTSFAQDINVPDPSFREFLSTYYDVTFDGDNNVVDPGTAPSQTSVNIPGFRNFTPRFNEVISLEGMSVFESITEAWINIDASDLVIPDIPNNAQLNVSNTFVSTLRVGDGAQSMRVLNSYIEQITFTSDQSYEGSSGIHIDNCEGLEEVIFLEDNQSDVSSGGYVLQIDGCPSLKRVEYQDSESPVSAVFCNTAYQNGNNDRGPLEELILPERAFLLSEVYCPGNRLESLTYPEGDQYLRSGPGSLNNRRLNCEDNFITNLDLNGLEFEWLYCGHNDLEGTLVVEPGHLTYFDCSFNNFTSIDLFGFQAIGYTDWDLSNNELTSIRFPRITINLGNLDVSNNQLTLFGLDLNVPAQFYNDRPTIDCSNNQLESFWVKNHGVFINIPGLDALDNPNLGCVFVGDKTASDVADYDLPPSATVVESQAECDALAGVEVPDAAFRAVLANDYGITFAGNFMTDPTEAEAIVTLDVRSEGISDLTGIEAFTSLRTLRAGTNNVTSVDVSQNADLRVLDLSRNNLTSLDLSQNADLRVLNLSRNSLTSIDLTQNGALTRVNCLRNSLTHFDIRNGNNAAITVLRADRNDLTCIFVDDASAIPTGWRKDGTATYVETEAACSALSAPDVSVSRNAVAGNNFAIFPNPVISSLRIDVGSAEMAGIEVFDLQGRQIMASTATSALDVSNLAAGTYLIRVLTTTDVHVQRFVKK